MGPPNDVMPSLRKTLKTSPAEPRIVLFFEPGSRSSASAPAGKGTSPIDSPLVRPFWRRLVGNYFAQQFSFFHGSQFDCLAAERGRAIILSCGASLALRAGGQIALLF